MSDDDDGEAEESASLTDGAVDAGSPQGVAAARREANRSRKRAEEFWRGVFSTEAGRREMWGLLAQAHTFEERFACGPNGFPQPEATWFHAGEQALGLRLYQSWLLMGIDLKKMHEEHDPRFAKPRRAARKPAESE